MPTYYSTADRDLTGLLDEVMQEHHPDLVEAGVTVSILCATNPEGPPTLKQHGYPCAAIIKINSLVDRVEGKADATLKLDFDGWADRTDDERRAILDHELYHLSVVFDGPGRIATDDANRPKLKMRLHDINVQGFEAIVDRHRTAALEAQAYIDLNRRMTQKTFPWG